MTTCLICGADIERKPRSQPGPQPKYCGRRCQTSASHRAYRQRVTANADAARTLATIGDIDWARVPAHVLADAAIRRYRDIA